MEKINNANASAKNSSEGVKTKKVYYDGKTEEEWDAELRELNGWTSDQPDETDKSISDDKVDTESEIFEEDEEEWEHKYYDFPCVLTMTVNYLEDGGTTVHRMVFENRACADEYREFFIALVTDGPISKDVHIWEHLDTCQIYIENDIFVVLEEVTIYSDESED